ncbi:hypothetical protein GCM10010435_58770 [Winogradskya consettensis]|uniref:histidine kinase n=1 Tax=Winogradskya consettensis TaxID=113560 RepID=A0A919SMR3_9ACTN|nr:histidine kinase [Actinoplanes consettensis]GIM74282.1 hypothetical protein Aco04nite_39510 [Actinoplanes consettensis]
MKPRISGARLSWLLCAAELPVFVVLTFTTAPTAYGILVVACVIATVLAWTGWLALQLRRGDRLPVDPAMLGLLVVVASTSGFAGVAGGSSWIVILMLVVCLHAATSLRRRAVVVPAAGAAAVGAGWAFGGGDGGTTLVLLALIGGFFAGGLARGLRQAQLREARAGQADRERAAALAERSRIAREIHDILAHSLADLSIQLELADALLTDAGDTSGARDRVRHAHGLAAEGMRETRRAVHALHSDAPPLPETLALLVGAQAALAVTGVPRPLPPAAGLALLRTAQEALTNARKHAPGVPITVDLRYDPHRTALTVHNAVPALSPPGSPEGGYGLAGMNERLRLAGGSLTAGTHSGGWTVRAEVPA